MGIVDIINAAGITPDVLTSRLAIRPEEISATYGRKIHANFRLLPRIPGLPSELATVLFNLMLGRFGSGYDLLINTSNSLIFLPKSKAVITYMFFPRKVRIMADVLNIHRPDTHFSRWSRVGLKRAILRVIYRLSKPHPQHTIVCMTEFTRSALEEVYEVPSKLPVIYPPVDVAGFLHYGGERTRAIVTVGRFGPAKRQLEQIELAERLPDIPFHIIGFTGNGVYYHRCEEYVETHRLSNVHLEPDASFEHMRTLLQSSKYFLHTLINEPFGLTAVQATAAGCLPLVHDSGGQRETVPEPRLRYQDLDQVPTLVDELEMLDTGEIDALIGKLQRHVKLSFDQEVFYQRMGSVLAPYLGPTLASERHSKSAVGQ